VMWLTAWNMDNLKYKILFLCVIKFEKDEQNFCSVNKYEFPYKFNFFKSVRLLLNG
jgi:hypothetical protein